jgi:beta-galactosidase
VVVDTENPFDLSEKFRQDSKVPPSHPHEGRTSLTAPATPQDIFLKTDSIQKGFVWINGTPLGRAWHVGPQASLFIPGSRLQQGQNRLVILNLQANGTSALETGDHALWIPGKDHWKKS